MVQTEGRIVVMVAKFSSNCCCGAFIERGDTMSYDTLMKKALCFECVRKSVEFGLPASAAKVSDDDSQKCSQALDRFRELRLHPRPYPDAVTEEMASLVCQFRHEFGGRELVRKFVEEIAKCSHKAATLSGVKARYPSACIHCGERVRVGDLILYDHHTRRAHCLNCDCLR
jgi:hypothetical protein